MPHIAVLGSSKIGNFVVTVPLLNALSKRYPTSTIDFWGSEATRDFEIALPCINWRFSWDSGSTQHLHELSTALSKRVKDAGPIDLLINCDGFNPVTQVLAPLFRPRYVAGATLGANLRSLLPWGDHPYQRFLADPDWDSSAFLERYTGFFNSNYIAELLCRLAFLDPPSEDLRLPSRDVMFNVPDILIHVTTTRAAKIWPAKHWLQVLSWCNDHSLTVGLVGSPPNIQQQSYNAGDIEDVLLSTGLLVDLRGQTSLIELAGACIRAKAVLSVDAGPMHISAAVGTPTLAIVGNDIDGIGASPIRLWMPRSKNSQRTVSSYSCDLCSSARFKNDACLKENHDCMDAVSPIQAISWLSTQLRLPDCAR